MGGGATFTESWTWAKACDPKTVASTNIKIIVSLCFIFVFSFPVYVHDNALELVSIPENQATTCE
jgi:hypothetical protein